MSTLWPWIAFNAVILAILALDLGLFDRNAHVVTTKQAGLWTIVWVLLALGFAAGIFYYKGHQSGVEFITGYLIEYSLSVDNIFVFVLLFSFFKVEQEYQHRILFWGILGALIARGAMIGAGAALIHRFEWITYLFGIFLVFTGIRMVFRDEADVHPGNNPVLKLVRKVIPVCAEYHGQSFFVRAPQANNAADSRTSSTRWMATPLFVVLLLIETTDIVFAIDSIPAVFSVTRDTFIVYTSNVCAILGLRSLYFLLAGAINRFHHLHYGLAAVLTFVGVKMLIAGFYEIPILLSLAFIFVALGISITTSLLFPQKNQLA